MVAMVPVAMSRHLHADQFFETAIVLFRALSRMTTEGLDVSTYLATWTELLLQHDHDEVSARKAVGECRLTLAVPWSR